MADNPTTIHHLKTWPEFFDAVQDGRKPFEVRRNDRNFALGDWLALERWEPELGDYTRDAAGTRLTEMRRVSYVLAGGQFGIDAGYVALGLEVA